MDTEDGQMRADGIRVLVSTTRRHVPPTDPSGYLYVVDPGRQQVVQRSLMIETPYRVIDTNPRGGLRGVKGISIRADQIAVANSLMIFLYDPSWSLLGTTTHPSCAAIHDITFQDDTLWVASARTDLLLQFNLSGQLLRHHYLRRPSPALAQLGWKPPVLMNGDDIQRGKVDFRNPLTHDQETYDRAHLNGVCVLSNGDILASLGQVIGAEYATLLRLKVLLIKMGLWASVMSVNHRLQHLKRNLFPSLTQGTSRAALSHQSQSAVVRIAEDGAHSLCLSVPSVSTPSHSLLALPDDSAVYLNTTEGTVLHFSPDSGEIYSSTKVTGGTEHREGFLRGAALLPSVEGTVGRTLLLGSKGELITFDLERLEVLVRFQYTPDPNESVYDIKVLPEHYALPPLSMEEHFIQAKGCMAGELIADKVHPADKGGQRTSVHPADRRLKGRGT
jgi:hypothetical protein